MTAKRFVTRLTAVTLAFCVTFLFSCAPKKIDVDEYPGFETIEETETENTAEKNTIPVEDIVENGGMTTKEFEEFISIPDPFEETGKFQFYIRLVARGKIIKDRAIDRLGLRKAFLLRVHKRFVCRAACAERVFEKMGVGDHKKTEFPHLPPCLYP